MRGLPAGRYRVTACSNDLGRMGTGEAHVPESGQVRLDVLVT
jgi:hypothetical protein